mmetsp:Transcript_2330/g.4887  ORF Transcript_2330/g.4887 Transcript_2330/m.4887 type:complete len:326 (-) Transcript_2330:591-1568(-)
MAGRPAAAGQVDNLLRSSGLTAPCMPALKLPGGCCYHNYVEGLAEHQSSCEPEVDTRVATLTKVVETVDSWNHLTKPRADPLQSNRSLALVDTDTEREMRDPCMHRVKAQSRLAAALEGVEGTATMERQGGAAALAPAMGCSRLPTATDDCDLPAAGPDERGDHACVPETSGRWWNRKTIRVHHQVGLWPSVVVPEKTAGRLHHNFLENHLGVEVWLHYHFGLASDSTQVYPHRLYLCREYELCSVVLHDVEQPPAQLQHRQQPCLRTSTIQPSHARHALGSHAVGLHLCWWHPRPSPHLFWSETLQSQSSAAAAMTCPPLGGLS